MVSFRPYGRLGNVLFMMGNAIAYALKHDEPFSAPYETQNAFWNPLYLPHLIDKNYIQGIEDVLINEDGFRWQEIAYEPHWKGKQIVLNGYWQSWKYIEEHRREILYAFDLRWLMKPNTASIHIRRGDYLQLSDKHPPYSLDYLNNAINYLKDEKGVTKFEIYSDDVLWCVENLTHIPNVKVMETGNELNDLVEASCCEHNICSSSTFSFFIAWLNRNPEKVCIFPKLWFVEGYHLDTSDLLHPDWLKM